MAEPITWTVDDVAARFAEAADVAHRLDPVRLPGHACVWPAIMRQHWERARDDERPRRLRAPPTGAAVDRLLEATRWLLWLTEVQRELVWLRAMDTEWHVIGRRMACDRVTAWRRWQRAMQRLADKLNAGEAPPTQLARVVAQTPRHEIPKLTNASNA